MAAAATGLLAAYGAPAFADSEAEAQAANSPGVVSGNVIQVPVNVPINVCGNTIDVIALLNPAVGNTCLTDVEADDEDGRGNPGGGHHPHHPNNPPGYGHEEPPGGGHENPPGGHENPPGDNENPPGDNEKPPAPGQENPPTGDQKPPADDRSVPPAPVPHGGDGPQLAETGAAGTAAAAAAAAALIGGGALLYRRGRVGAC